MTYTEIANGVKTTYGFKTNLNVELCCTCKHYNNSTGICDYLVQHADFDFICDGYRRKHSGQYRRKRAKYNR